MEIGDGSMLDSGIVSMVRAAVLWHDRIVCRPARGDREVVHSSIIT
jgi:hypothetical protein